MNKSIIIKETAHKELKKLSESLRMQYGSLVEAMIFYFKNTGIDPKNAINQNPSVMVKALDKRIVSFMKVQEKDILKPLRNEVYQYSNELKKQYNDLKEEINGLSKWNQDVVIKINDLDKNRTKLIVEEIRELNLNFKKQQEAIIEIAKLIDLKDKSSIQGKLKTLFNANK
jgi:mRNA-degrading endonuclease RelE of RelBE toxin-antitoxin system